MIKTPEEHAIALVRVDELIKINPMPKTPEFKELMVLAIEVEKYEKIHFPFPFDYLVDGEEIL